MSPTEPNENYLKSKYRVQKADEISVIQIAYKEMYEESKPAVATIIPNNTT